jgi:hypothetical protein
MNINDRSNQKSGRVSGYKIAFMAPLILSFCAIAWAAQSIINTMPILTTADHDDGVSIFDDDSSIVNTSMVTTQGVSADGLRIDGLNAFILNTSSGQVVTEGDQFAVGIRLGRPTATVENAGSITTSGSNGDGIVLFGGDGNVTNSGSILVQGVGADGFVVEGGDTILTNSGSIRSTGGVRTEDPSGNPIFDDATGVYLAGPRNVLYNLADALIETTGEFANTVNAFVDGTRVENEGIITASGNGSQTISVIANRDVPVSIINSGDILNSGEGPGGPNGDVSIRHRGLKFELVNFGSIEASGTSGTAIYSRTSAFVEETQPEVNLLNFGTITTLGSESLATIFLDGGGQNLENGPLAVIAQASGTGDAIRALSGGQQRVRNWGDIIGNVSLGEMDDYFLIGESGVVEGIVDGGTEIDELEALIVGHSSTILGPEFINFEKFTKSGMETLSIQGQLDLEATGFAQVTQGSLCLASGSELVTGVLEVGDGATLCGAGTLDGELIVLPGGNIEPGFSPGTLTVDGALSTDNAMFTIEISGTGAEMLDQINVGGDAEIDGGFILYSFINGFLPQKDDVFEWLKVEGLLSLDSSVISEIQGVAPGFNYSLEIGPGGLILVALDDAEPVSQQVIIDLRPGNRNNNLDPMSDGLVSLAVFSEAASGAEIGFDATKVNDTFASLGTSHAMAVKKKTKHRDVDHDGLIDTILYFRINGTGIQCGDERVEFEGLTFGQSILNGITKVRTVNCE